jgi:endonuclease YncB( thermonuclease family)
MALPGFFQNAALHMNMRIALKVAFFICLPFSIAAIWYLSWLSFGAIGTFSARQGLALAPQAQTSTSVVPDPNSASEDENRTLVSRLSEFGVRQHAAGDHATQLTIAPEQRRTIVLNSPVFAVTSSSLQDEDGVLVRLFGLNGFERHEVCTNFSELRFACGLHGRAALGNLIRGRRINCSVLRETNPKEVEAICFTDAVNSLNAQQVIDGWATPMPTQVSEYKDAIELRCTVQNDRSKGHALCAR